MASCCGILGRSVFNRTRNKERTMSAIADEIIAKTNATHAKFLAYIASLDAEAVNRRPAGDRWSPREIVAHLTDAERAHRRFMQVVVSGSEMPVIENFDL